MSEERRPLVKKMLESGLIDHHTAKMMEQWQLLPPGSADMVQEERLKDATKETLTQIADELGSAMEEEQATRETALDLKRIRWPALITIFTNVMDQCLTDLSCVRDHLGRYYIQLSDIQPELLVPGYIIRRKNQYEVITESQKLFIGQAPVCYQVATRAIKMEDEAQPG